jgi:hypothetical protein
MSYKIIKESKDLSAVSYYKKSYIIKYKRLIIKVFYVAFSFKSFLVLKAF